MSMNLETGIQQLLREIAPREEETKLKKQKLNEIISHIMSAMENSDDLFNSLYLRQTLSGSTNENIHLKLGSDFDVHVMLSSRKLTVQSSGTGFVKLRSADDDHYMLLDDGYVSPSKVCRWLVGVVDKALPTVRRISNVRMLRRSTSGPAVTLTLTYAGYDFEIDLVPVFEFNINELQGKTERINRYSKPGDVWRIVPKSNHDARTWRISMWSLEKRMIHNKNHMKSIVKLIKAFKHHRCLKHLPSYNIKTVFMWKDNDLGSQSDQYWARSLSVLLKDIVQEFATRIGQGNLKDFWFPDYNHIQRHDVNSIHWKEIGTSFQRVCNRLSSVSTSDQIRCLHADFGLSC